MEWEKLSKGLKWSYGRIGRGREVVIPKEKKKILDREGRNGSLKPKEPQNHYRSKHIHF